MQQRLMSETTLADANLEFRKPLSECPFCKKRCAIPALWEQGECKKCHAPFIRMAKRQKAY